MTDKKNRKRRVLNYHHRTVMELECGCTVDTKYKKGVVPLSFECGGYCEYLK